MDDAVGPARTGDAEEDSENDGNDSETDPASDDSFEQTAEPDPQSPALRRQQLLVGVGVSVLSGLAIVAAGIQQFPGYPLPAYFAAGMVTSGVLFVLLSASLFRGGTS